MKPRIVIAGAGPTGLALAARATGQWKPIVIDTSAEQLALAARITDVRIEQGDATSVLVLKRAEVKGAGNAVAVTGDDEVNLEFCRLMKEQFGVGNLVALVQNAQVAERMQEIGVVTVSRPDSVAAILESSLDRGRRTASNVGLGRGEICQVTVTSHSPVIGKSLSTIRPQSWLLGAIYRNNQLVVPHGNTAIEAGDKCLLVGDPTVLEGIADYFQRGTSEFPLQFGTQYCLVQSEDMQLPDLDECQWLLDHTEVKGVTSFHRCEAVPEAISERFGEEVLSRQLPGGALGILTRQTDDVDCALLVWPSLHPSWRDHWRLKDGNFFATLERATDPVLVSRGSHPYKRILVAISPSAGSQRAAELAVDIARKFEAELTAVAVQPPDFVVGAEYKEKLRAALDAVKAKAQLYSRQLKTQLVEGNPVTQVVDLSRDFDLLVIAHRKGRRFSLTRTDVSRHQIMRAACSVMILPYGVEENGRE